MSDQLNLLLFGALPYAVIAIFVVGHIYRYKTSQYSWTTRSSQLLEAKWLRMGVIIFHLGLLAAIGGHIGGLLVPASVTQAVGISDDMYHMVAVVMGSLAGIAICVGLFILTLRRAANERIRKVTTGRDYLVFAVLIVVVLTGMMNTVGVGIFDLGNHHEDYRETVSPWFRSILMLQPDPTLMQGASWSFQAHAMSAMFLFAIWPFTRLVHAWSIPVTYPLRPYIIYRRRDSVAR